MSFDHIRVAKGSHADKKKYCAFLRKCIVGSILKLLPTFWINRATFIGCSTSLKFVWDFR